MLTLDQLRIDANAIREQHRLEVSEVAEVFGSTDPEEIGDWLDMPIWNAKRALEALGLREPDPPPVRTRPASCDPVKFFRHREPRAPRPPKPPPPPGFCYGSNGHLTPTAETCRAIVEAVKREGLTFRVAAKRFGVSDGTVRRCLLGLVPTMQAVRLPDEEDRDDERR